MLPLQIKTRIEHALGDAITDVAPVSGGCISNASKVITAGGQRAFLKWGDHTPLFHAEAEALAAIRATNTVRVPQLIAQEEWLLLEWLEPGPLNEEQWAQLGSSLAALHRTQTGLFGWSSDNFIGTLPQSNTPSADWPAFWRDRRIRPQLHGMSAQHRARIERMLEHCDELHAGSEDGPSLLHGDLWNGNVHGVKDGSPALVDPSIYYGHREVDLAMAALFGGFPREFFDAYDAAWPLLPGYERRRCFYQLYYMLVHVNLFGGAYVSGAMSLVGKLGF